MATVSITDAAKLAGVARANLYRTYIRKGRLSVSYDNRGRPVIETSELLRVFGSLKPLDRSDDVTVLQKITPENSAIDIISGASIARLEAEVAGKSALIEALKEENRKLWDLNEELRVTVKQLSHIVEVGDVPQKRQRPWWRFWS